MSVGRSEDVEPELVDAEVGALDPGEQTVVTVPLELPMAAFGNYRVVGQVGDTELGAFEVEWTTYPWGLFALNVLALVLLAWGIRTRLAAAAPGAAPPRWRRGDADAVVDLAAADAWWAYRLAPGRARCAVGRADRPAPGRRCRVEEPRPATRSSISTRPRSGGRAVPETAFPCS